MKKVLSVFLSCCIFCTVIFAPGISAAGVNAAPLTVDGGSYPFILIRGVDFGAMSTDYGTPQQAPAVEAITAGGIVMALLKAAGAGIVHGSVERAVDSLLDYADSILGKLSCDKNGASVYDLGLNRYPLSAANYTEELITGGGRGAEEGIVKSAVERYGADNVYYFTYDWRLNPLDICDEINEMVTRATRERGTAKVNLVCASMGGIEAVAYLSKYGYEKINTCVFLSSTFYGLYMVSDLFCGRVDVSDIALYNFLEDKAGGNALLNFALKTMKRTGLFRLAGSFAGQVIEEHKDNVYDGFIRDTLGTMPVWWSLVLPEDYDEAIQYMFGGHEEEYAGIIALSRELQVMVTQRDALLKDAAANGVQIAVVANYNSPAMPLYERALANSDGGLETALVSGGAKVAHYGTTLGADYIPSNPAFLSPDRVIDAATCLFPDSTWFVKDGGHVACSYASEYSDFLFWLVDFDRPTVFSDERYPQFLLSGSGETISKLQ